MKGYNFSDNEEENAANEAGKANEINAAHLFNTYISLIKTFNVVSTKLLGGKLIVD